MLAPGLLKLLTKPARTGSAPPTNTIGIVVVAAIMAGMAKLLPTITATRGRTRSAASAGSRPKSSSAKRSSMATSLPSTNPASARPLRNAATRCIEVAADVLRRIPITGIVGCCARAASGIANAPPTAAMNSRRLMSALRLRKRHDSVGNRFTRGRPMSALGQKATWRPALSMSALPPKADVGVWGCNVRFVPIADVERGKYWEPRRVTA